MLVGLSGCGLGDSGTEWREGHYELSWVDDPRYMRLMYELRDGVSVARVNECVFAVGSDGKYLVAKQHPQGDASVTNYFIVDVRKDGPEADPQEVVLGPFDELRYRKLSEELQLPAFTEELEWLK